MEVFTELAQVPGTGVEVSQNSHKFRVVTRMLYPYITYTSSGYGQIPRIWFATEHNLKVKMYGSELVVAHKELAHRERSSRLLLSFPYRLPIFSFVTFSVLWMAFCGKHV